MTPPPFGMPWRSACGKGASCSGTGVACEHASASELIKVLVRGTEESHRVELERKLTLGVVNTFIESVALLGPSVPRDLACVELTARLARVSAPGRIVLKEDVALMLDNCERVIARDHASGERCGAADIPAIVMAVADNVLLRVDRSVCILCHGPLTVVCGTLANDDVTAAGEKRKHSTTESAGPEVLGEHFTSRPIGASALHATLLMKRCVHCPVAALYGPRAAPRVTHETLTVVGSGTRPKASPTPTTSPPRCGRHRMRSIISLIHLQYIRLYYKHKKGQDSKPLSIFSYHRSDCELPNFKSW
jgi:hypothetical protein